MHTTKLKVWNIVKKLTIKVPFNDEMVNINTEVIHKNCKCMNDYFLTVTGTQISFLKTAK